MKELEVKNIYNKCIIDDDDYERYKSQKCYSDKRGHISFWRNGNIQLHRDILKVTSKYLVVDHIDGNPLNNQKNNLRICERSENCKNNNLSSRNTSGYKGVSFYKLTHTWKASIDVNMKYIHLGYFKTKEEAAQAYDEASQKYHKNFASTNVEIKKREPIVIRFKETKYDDPNLKLGMIPLGNNIYTYVDIEDYENVKNHAWHLCGKYASGRIDGKNIYLHRFIMKPERGSTVDHIDRNHLNNRKENLRICSLRENSYNRKISKNKYQGVSFKNKKWIAAIRDNYLGSFDSEEEAAEVYNRAALKEYGVFAFINKIED